MRENRQARKKKHFHVMTHPPPSQTNEFIMDMDTVGQSNIEHKMFPNDMGEICSVAELPPCEERQQDTARQLQLYLACSIGCREVLVNKVQRGRLRT